MGLHLLFPAPLMSLLVLKGQNVLTNIGINVMADLNVPSNHKWPRRNIFAIIRFFNLYRQVGIGLLQ